MPVTYQHREVSGHRLYYRDAGPRDAPVVVLLHGYPTSSFMFRNLIPLLAGRFRVIAPDHLGYGFSDAPPVTQLRYTFDALADLTRGLLAELGVDRYAMYVQDYGAPVGWRLALAHPEHVTAVVSQNGNAYDEGFVEDFWSAVWAFAAEQNPETEAALRPALGIDAIRWQYTHGVPRPDTVDPETWHHDAALVSRPGNDEAQLALFADYVTNVALYPRLQQYFRDSQVPLLAVWGRNDEIFGPDGARAFPARPPRRRGPPPGRRPLPAGEPPGGGGGADAGLPGGRGRLTRVAQILATGGTRPARAPASWSPPAAGTRSRSRPRRGLARPSSRYRCGCATSPPPGRRQ